MLNPGKYLHMGLNLRVLLILLQVCTLVVTHKFRGEFGDGGEGEPPTALE